MYLEGKKPEEIAVERGLAPTTIFGHLAHGVNEGLIELEELVDQETIDQIRAVEGKFDGLKAYYEHFNGQFDYGTLRLVLGPDSKKQKEAE